MKERNRMRSRIFAIVLAVGTIAFSKIKKDAGLAIGDISGKYKYKEHALFKNDQPLDVSKMYEPISMEILPDSTILCALRMTSQKDVTVGKAKIKEIGESNGEKYWIAEWEGMNYPVRTVFSKSGKRLKYEIVFTNSSDAVRYGMKEVSELVQK